MTMMSGFNRSRLRNILFALTAVVATAGTALPQSSGNAAKPFSDDGEYSAWDIGGFFGAQWFQLWQGTKAENHLLEPKVIIGARATFDLGKYWGVEGAFSTGFNRLFFLPYGGTGYASVSEYNYQFAAHGLAYLTPRSSRYRPYVEFGPTGVVYQPSKASSLQQPTVGIPAITPAGFSTKTVPGYDYGIGLKINASHKIAVRIDLMGLWTPTPDFGLPNAPGAVGSLYIPTKRNTNGLQLDTEISWRGGFHEPPVIPTGQTFRNNNALPSPSVPALTIRGGGANACPGDNVPAFSVTTTPPAGLTFTAYQWLVNGTPAPGGNGPAFTLPTNNGPGAKVVNVRVTVAWQGSSTERPPVPGPGPNDKTITTDVLTAGTAQATSNNITVTVGAPAPPTIQFTVVPTRIRRGDRLPLNATATVFACATATPVRYTATDGTIAGTTFDSSSVNVLPGAEKLVTLTATETDSRNQMVARNAAVTVFDIAVAEQVDIKFPNRSSRVNNAAKRYLIEQLTPKLKADPSSTVVLIGHRDDMTEAGRVYANLDTQRVLNTAAVLSAGKPNGKRGADNICSDIDLSRIQVKSVGIDQTDPFKPFNGGSNVVEARGQSANDPRSQYRRVEVWFVPGGAASPATGLGPAPEKEIKAKGCPR